MNWHRMTLVATLAALGCGQETGPCDNVVRNTVFSASLQPVPPATLVPLEVGMTMEDYGHRLARRPAAIRWFGISADTVPSVLHAAIDTIVTTSPALSLPPQTVFAQVDSIVASAIIDPLAAGRGWFYLLDASGTIVATGPILRVSGGDIASACFE